MREKLLIDVHEKKQKQSVRSKNYSKTHISKFGVILLEVIIRWQTHASTTNRHHVRAHRFEAFPELGEVLELGRQHLLPTTSERINKRKRNKKNVNKGVKV